MTTASKTATSKQDAIRNLAAHVEGIEVGDSDDYDCEFSARAAWAAKTLACIGDDRVEEINYSATDITETRGCGRQTMLIYVTLAKADGGASEVVISVPHVSWQNTSRGGRMYEARYITQLSQRQQRVISRTNA